MRPFGSLTVQHQCHVVDGLEQKPPRQLSKPAIDRLPGSKVGSAASASRNPNGPGYESASNCWTPIDTGPRNT
jgi:hypothetical protein